MPIDYKKYPPNWKQTRQRILKRADYKCEVCEVPAYAVGFRRNGLFIPSHGSIFYDMAGQGLSYPSLNKLSYQEARDIADGLNEVEAMNGSATKYIVVVLTIAHLDHDADNWSVKDSRLKAMCQKCHLDYDRKMKAEKRKAKRYRNSLFPFRYQ